MGSCFLYGNGGGSSLNFKVVGGTSAPANPSENTIWVNTSAAITGWVFSPDAPGNPAEGLVWIRIWTDSAATFNALKKNNMTVCPLYANQYVSGAWVVKTAQSYQGGNWVSWYRYLYDSGAFDSIGAFNSFSYGISTSASTRIKPAQTNGATYVKLSITKSSSNNDAAGSCFSASKVNVTPYSKLKINVSSASADTDAGNTRICITSDKADKFTAAASKTIISNGSSVKSPTVFTCDISNVSGSYYVVVSFNGAASQTITFTQIWLE